MHKPRSMRRRRGSEISPGSVQSCPWGVFWSWKSCLKVEKLSGSKADTFNWCSEPTKAGKSLIDPYTLSWVHEERVEWKKTWETFARTEVELKWSQNTGLLAWPTVRNKIESPVGNCNNFQSLELSKCPTFNANHYIYIYIKTQCQPSPGAILSTLYVLIFLIFITAQVIISSIIPILRMRKWRQRG